MDFFSKAAKKGILPVIAVLICATGILSAATFAWLTGSRTINCELVEGSIITQYFHCGCGSEDDPFVITRPVHYYNLVNLYQRLDGFANEDYYFQLGYQLKDGDDGYYFYDYNDNGQLVKNSYTTELNMAYYSEGKAGALLPIGTSEKSFGGTFNGNELTVKNLHIKALDVVGTGADEKIFGTCDVGIFGYVDENADIHDAYFENVVIDLADSDPAADCPSKDVHEMDGSDIVYVGYIAGHIMVDTTVQNVYVNDCTILGGSGAMSEFGYFGCVENHVTGEKVEQLGSEVATLRARGDDAGFGGSIDMADIFDRLLEVSNKAYSAGTGRYISAETVIYDPLEETRTVVDGSRTYANARANFDQTRYFYYYSTPAGGSFNISSSNRASSKSGTSNIYECLYGASDRFPINRTLMTLSEDFTDAIYIHKDDSYLNRSSATAVSVASEDDASFWIFDSNHHLYTQQEYCRDSEGRICVVPNPTNFYLNLNGLNVVTGTSANTQWYIGEKGLYTLIDGTEYYLDYSDYWYVSPEQTYRLYDSGDDFLSYSAGSFENVLSPDDSIKWLVSDPEVEDGGTTEFYAYIGGAKNYLTLTNGLSFTTTPTSWTRDRDGFYITKGGLKYYLTYDDAEDTWTADIITGRTISDGDGNYLKATASGVENTDEDGATLWQMSSGNIYASIGGTLYYLTYTPETGLVVSTDSGSVWQSGLGECGVYTTVGSTDYYLIFEDGNWDILADSYYTVANGDDYLVFDGTDFSSTQDEAEASHIGFSDTSDEDAPAGIISVKVGDDTYYLVNNNGTLSTTTNVANASSWQNDDGSIYIETPGFYYILENAGDTWFIDKIKKGITIYDGDGIYLNANARYNGIESDNDPDTATLWVFENGRILTYDDGDTPHYLNFTTANGLAVGNTATTTTWEYDDDFEGYYCTVNSIKYYLTFKNGTWRAEKNIPEGYSTIAYRKNTTTNYYLNASGSGVVSGTSTDSATAWKIESSGDSYTFSTEIGGETKYLGYRQTSSGYTYSYSLALTDDPVTWTKTNSRYYVNVRTSTYSQYTSKYYIYSSNQGAWSMSTSTRDLTFTDVSNEVYSTYSEEADVEMPSLDTELTVIETPVVYIENADMGVPPSEIYGPLYDNFEIEIDDSLIRYVTQSTETEKSGNNTYFPLRVDKDENGDFPDDYAASYKNTGYVISGANIEHATSSGSNTEFQKSAGDIRFAGWPISNISGSYSKDRNGNVTFNVYTVDDSGNHAMTNVQKASEVYQSASEQLIETLSGESRVYGVHFMDAAITMDHLITVPEAMIYGKLYENYQLPEDSIDFNVIERGTISFFAGEYFTGNNAFFSLHTIYRKNDKKIIELDEYDPDSTDIAYIFEIQEVYESPSGASKPYIYKMKDSDGSVYYTNADSTFTMATSLNEAISNGGSGTYTSVFKTSWITAPTGLSTDNKRLYYFEIPCNAGEYALGSVSGKTGAYLVYLDIATNGGDVIQSIISSEGNSITDSFDVEYRNSPDTVDYSILQFSVNVPDGTDASTYSVNMHYDRDNLRYTLDVVNKSGEDITLYVFLCDDDDDLFNEFPYCYNVSYTNSDSSGMITHDGDETDWKSVAGFTIPSSGAPEELTYIS